MICIHVCICKCTYRHTCQRVYAEARGWQCPLYYSACSLEPGSLPGPEVHVFSTRVEVNKSQASSCLWSAWSWSYRCVLGSGCWHLNSVPHVYTASALSHWSILQALESPEWARLTLLLLWQWWMQRKPCFSVELTRSHRKKNHHLNIFSAVVTDCNCDCFFGRCSLQSYSPWPCQHPQIIKKNTPKWLRCYGINFSFFFFRFIGHLVKSISLRICKASSYSLVLCIY